ncbi:hypothetical protein BG030_19470 [Pseudomonas putida]|nr:hypothetical protein BG030_19470 [Pseudomonas putida]
MSQAADLEPTINFKIPTSLTTDFTGEARHHFSNIQDPVNDYIPSTNIGSKQTKLFLYLLNPYFQLLFSAIFAD